MNTPANSVRSDKKTISESGAALTALKLSTVSIALPASFLLLLSLNNLSVFAQAEFTYIESIGWLLAFLTLLTLSIYFLVRYFLKLQIKNRLLKILFYFGVIAGSSLSLLLVSTFIWLRFDVKTNCLAAKNEYGGSCSQALTKQLQDENQGFRSRNSAIWTLGQLADKSALPALYALYTGDIPDREPLSGMISQYELKKAITWCEQGNSTSWMYSGM